MKVQITVRPTGYISLDGEVLRRWPPVGAVVDMPELIARDLINSGRAENAPLAKVSDPCAEACRPDVKVRMTVKPTGYVSLDGGPLAEWPAVGTVVNLPDAVAQDLITSGRAQKVVVAKARKVAEGDSKRPGRG